MISKNKCPVSFSDYYILSEISTSFEMWVHVLYLSDSGPDVLPYRLPTTDPGCQQLRVGRADSAGAAPNAPSLPGGCGREPSPPSVPAAGARQGGLQGWAADPADGGHFLRYRGLNQIPKEHLLSSWSDSIELSCGAAPLSFACTLQRWRCLVVTADQRHCHHDHTALITQKECPQRCLMRGFYWHYSNGKILAGI